MAYKGDKMLCVRIDDGPIGFFLMTKDDVLQNGTRYAQKTRHIFVHFSALAADTCLLHIRTDTKHAHLARLRIDHNHDAVQSSLFHFRLFLRQLQRPNADLRINRTHNL